VRLVEQNTRVVGGADDGKQTWKQLRALNQLGVTRGTLNLL
jgi:putative protease